MIKFILILSYCKLIARGKLSVKIPWLGNFSKTTAKVYIDYSELIDSENLVKITNDRLFDKNDIINYDLFKLENDETNSYIFTYKGIRYMLKENNV